MNLVVNLVGSTLNLGQISEPMGVFQLTCILKLEHHICPRLKRVMRGVDAVELMLLQKQNHISAKQFHEKI